MKKSDLRFLLFISLCPLLGAASNQVQSDEERMIWEESEKEIKKIQASGIIFQNDSLNYYLNHVLIELVKNKVDRLQPRVNVIMSPALNAFAYPNGQIYIHSGLLVKMENEAQLATLLGHEITHSIRNHAVQGFRDFRSKADASIFLEILTAGFGLAGGVMNLLGQVGLLASVYGYSRENESEADNLGFRLVAEAGYNIQESPALFKILKKDLELEPPKEETSFFYSTHPKLDDRISNFQKMIKSNPDTGTKVNTRHFLEKIKKLTIHNCQLDIKAGRLKSAQHTIDLYKTRYSDDQSVKILQLELDQVVAQQKGTGAESIEKSLHNLYQSDSLNADALRGLGKMYLKKEQFDSALFYFEKYISNYPAAKDIGYINSYIKKCREKR